MLGLYDPTHPTAADQLRLLTDAFDLGATVEEVIRAAAVHYRIAAGNLVPGAPRWHAKAASICGYFVR